MTQSKIALQHCWIFVKFTLSKGGLGLKLFHKVDYVVTVDDFEVICKTDCDFEQNLCNILYFSNYKLNKIVLVSGVYYVFLCVCILKIKVVLLKTIQGRQISLPKFW